MREGRFVYALIGRYGILGVVIPFDAWGIF